MTIKKVTFYRMTCLNTRETYVGSTTMEPKTRLQMHLANFRAYKKGFGNCCSSFQIIERDNFIFQVILEVDAKKMTVYQKRKKEAELIAEEKTKRHCVNRNVPGRSREQYRIDNRDYINAYARDYYYDKTKHDTKYCCFCDRFVIKKYYNKHIHCKKHLKNLLKLSKEIKNTDESKKESKISLEIKEVRLERDARNRNKQSQTISI